MSPLEALYHQTRVRRYFIGGAVLTFVSLLTSCASPKPVEQRYGDANTPAGKAGQAAHKVAVEADKAGRVIGRKLNQAAHDAREGWKEAARKDAGKK